MKGGWRFRLAPTFFGPSNNLKENFLEQAFILQYHLHMNYSDVREMPIRYRQWFVKRLSDELERKAEDAKKASDEQRGLRDIPMGEMNQVMNQIGNPDSSQQIPSEAVLRSVTKSFKS